tara:strand:+ start:347 stop:691 length:345 start_codon:yes stop_codon:yes gene_type:complete
MAQIKIMYWKEIPIQIQAEDDCTVKSKLLDDKFQKAADAISMIDGSYGTDDYLNGWQWGEYKKVDKDIDMALNCEVDKFNKYMPKDFVSRIKQLHEKGLRKETPGAINHWLKLN